MDCDTYIAQNRVQWDKRTPYHVKSAAYDVEGFRSGKCTLRPIELNELGDVTDRSVLHLQCHFGLDTLSLARRGAVATGVDFSPEAIKTAQALSRETGISARFICSDVLQLVDVLDERFDIVFASYGIFSWIPSLSKWMETAAHFLKQGGVLYILDGHPVSEMLETNADGDLVVKYSYFHDPLPLECVPEGTYADRCAEIAVNSFQWAHSLGDFVNATIGAGMEIEFLREHARSSYQCYPGMSKDEEGYWRFGSFDIPLLFSMKAIKL